MTRWLDSTRRQSWRVLAAGGLLVLAACAGPIEREQGVLNEDSASLMRVAANARDAGDPAAAVPLYTRAARLSPLSVDPWIALGRTFNELAAYDEAADAWTEALFLEPKNVAALTGYGVSLTGLNQPHLALAKYEAAAEVLIDPEGVVPETFDERAMRNGLGVVYDMLGDAGRAQQSYRAGLRLDPRDLNLSNNLGLSLALSGEYEAAIDILSDVVEHPRAGAKHRLNLALAYGLAGRSEEAAQVARIDLDEQLVRQNLSYYHVIRGLKDHAERVAAVGSLRHQLKTPEVAQRRVGPREVGRVERPPDDTSAAATLAVVATPKVPPIQAPPSNGQKTGAALAVVELSTLPPMAPEAATAVEAAAVVPAAGAAPEAGTAVSVDNTLWRIQLGAVRQLATAEAEWARLQEKHRSALGDRELHLQTVALDTGTFIRIQTGPFADQLAARAMCDGFRQQQQTCLVVPPRP